MGKVIHIHLPKKATKDTLQGGSSKAAFSHNVKTEVNAGKPVKQAVAIAYSKQRETNDAPDTSKGHWITVNGAHIRVSEGGKITAGPADLKKALEHHKNEAKKHEKTNESLSEAHNNARRSLAAASQVPEAEHAQIRQYWTKHAEKHAREATKHEQSSKSASNVKSISSKEKAKARQTEIKSLESQILRIEYDPDAVEGGAKAFYSGRQTTLKPAAKKKLDKLNQQLDKLLDQVEQH